MSAVLSQLTTNKMLFVDKQREGKFSRRISVELPSVIIKIHEQLLALQYPLKTP